MAKKTVKYAKLHQGVFVAGIGTLGDTLPPGNKSYPKFEMIKVSDGIDCTVIPQPPSPQIPVKFWVPSANVANAVYGPELPDEDKS